MALTLFSREKFDLSSDALLISSGAYAAVASLTLPLWWWSSGRHIDPATPGSGVIESSLFAWVVVTLMLTVGLYMGPAITWALHGRRHRLRLLLAPAISPFLVLFIAILGEPFAALFQAALSPFLSWEYAGPAIAFGFLGAVHLSLVLYSLIRVRARRIGEPRLLQRLRYGSFLALAALTMIVGGALANGYDATVIQALLVILAIGYAAGLTTHLAAILDEI